MSLTTAELREELLRAGHSNAAAVLAEEAPVVQSSAPLTEVESAPSEPDSAPDPKEETEKHASATPAQAIHSILRARSARQDHEVEEDR